MDHSLPRVTASPERPAAPGRSRLAAALIAVAVALTALIGSAAVSAGPAGATSVEDVFTTKINQARAARGIPKLTTRGGLVTVARNWAATMASQSKLYHNPRLTSAVSNWQYVGENIGYGPDALTVHVAFMNSPGHRANILDRDYSEVGVGAVVVGDRVWVAEVFRRPMRVTTSSVKTTSGFPGRLTYGSTGTAVKKVQGRLGLSTTGYYGSYTRSAVSRFQKSLGWRGRGNVGRHTWARLF